jgi:hypothetical protein
LLPVAVASGPLQPLMDKPWPVGILVRAKRVADVPLYLDCGEHILETYSDAQPITYGSGWVQNMKCLICGRVTAALDVDAFWELADQAWLVNRIEWVEEVLRRSQQALGRLRQRAEGKREEMVDFG